MQRQGILLIAACSGFLAVAIGAFGAHAIKDTIEPTLYTIYETGVQYHFYHSLALLGLATLTHEQLSQRLQTSAALAFFLGIVLFSGSLYLLAVTGVRALGMITPLGGLAFLLGWAVLIYAAIVAYRR